MVYLQLYPGLASTGVHSLSTANTMSGLKTDVDFSESRAVKVNVVGWVFTGFAIATVGLKVTARHMVRRLGWDDFFIFFSTVCLAIYGRYWH